MDINHYTTSERAAVLNEWYAARTAYANAVFTHTLTTADENRRAAAYAAVCNGDGR